MSLGVCATSSMTEISLENLTPEVMKEFSWDTLGIVWLTGFTTREQGCLVMQLMLCLMITVEQC